MKDVPILALFVGIGIAGCVGYTFGSLKRENNQLTTNTNIEAKEVKQKASKNIETMVVAHQINYDDSSAASNPCKLESEITTLTVQNTNEMTAKLKSKFSLYDEKQQIHSTVNKDIQLPRYSLGIVVKKPLERILSTALRDNLTFGPEIGVRLFGGIWLNSHIFMQDKEVGLALRYEF